MVQLSSCPTLNVTNTTSLGPSDGGDQHQGEKPTMSESLVVDSPTGWKSGLEISTEYYGYETYIEDGLICLKHKVRNLEKKKVSWFISTYHKAVVVQHATNVVLLELYT